MFRIIQDKITKKKIRISFKNTVETAKFIKNRTLLSAKNMIHQVLSKKKCIVFKRYNIGVKRVPKSNDILGSHNQGRYPVKSCLIILSLINDIEKINNINKKEGCLFIIKKLEVNRTGRYNRKNNSAFGKILRTRSSICSIQMQIEQIKKN